MPSPYRGHLKFNRTHYRGHWKSHRRKKKPAHSRSHSFFIMLGVGPYSVVPKGSYQSVIIIDL